MQNALNGCYCAGWGLPHGGMAPLGHGKREGPAGDKLSATADDAGYGGRVRKERSDWSPPVGSPHPSENRSARRGLGLS